MTINHLDQVYLTQVQTTITSGLLTPTSPPHLTVIVPTLFTAYSGLSDFSLSLLPVQVMPL